MKQSQSTFLALSLLLPFSLASAISPELVGEQYFDGGVHIEGVEQPEGSDLKTGSSKVILGGTGVLTIGSKTGGGFPRVSVVGGTTITSTRYWSDETARPTWWDGQFSVPGSGRAPSQYDINFSSANGLDVIGAYSWGLASAGEVFSFSTPARMVFPAPVADGQKVFLAFYSNGQWSIDASNYCIVSSELCYAKVSSMSSIALVKEVYESCPISSVENGTVGSIPSCVVTCDRDYKLGTDGVSCEAVDGSFTEGGTEGGGHGVENSGGGEYTYEESPAAEYEFPNGYFRYQGTRAQSDRNLDETGLKGDDLKTVKQLNRGYYSRNARTIESQVKEDVVKEKDDSFLNYILQMRNTFKQDQINKELTHQTDELRDQIVTGELSSKEKGEKGRSEAFHSGAPLLPSTGPEVFVTIAVIGFLMMLFGARRRN